MIRMPAVEQLASLGIDLYLDSYFPIEDYVKVSNVPKTSNSPNFHPYNVQRAAIDQSLFEGLAEMAGKDSNAALETSPSDPDRPVGGDSHNAGSDPPTNPGGVDVRKSIYEGWPDSLVECLESYKIALKIKPEDEAKYYKCVSEFLAATRPVYQHLTSNVALDQRVWNLEKFVEMEKDLLNELENAMFGLAEIVMNLEFQLETAEARVTDSFGDDEMSN